MIVAHYAHRLPSNYDIDLIRKRAKERGVLWDSIPELYFKGFLLRERGRFGANPNNYYSLYLWRQDAAIRDFLVTGRYRTVTDSFGRAEIQTRFALDACKGSGQEARFAYKDEADIPVDADLTTAFASEIERNRERAEHSGIVVAAVGVDAQNWKFTRILLSSNEPDRHESGEAYEILHLARPLLDTLPRGAAR